MLRLTIMAIMSIIASGAALADGPLVIKNDRLVAEYNAAASTLSLRTAIGKNTFVPAAKLINCSGKARVISVTDPNFGKGQAIEITSTDGRKDEIALYPKFPFALLRRTITNTLDKDMSISREETLAATLDLGKPASELSLIGTGGWKKASEPVGSFEWIAIAQPVTRHGVVAGWLTHDKACGVIFSKEQDGQVELAARSDFGTLRIKPGKSAALETLAIGYFDDARLGLEAWADAVAKVYKIKLPPEPVGYCTWYHAGASNEKDVIRDAGIAAEKLKPYGFTFMQIDDGWQDGSSTNGPNKNFTRVRPGGPYPGGMKPVADAVVAKGLTAGIWFMPFSGNHDDPWWADKQGWFFKTKAGKPYEANWSGTLIDMTVPEAREYLREEVRRIKDWGYRYFKMDGLHSGTGTKQTYPNMWYTEDGFGDSVLSDPDKTHIEAYRDGLKLVRDAAGKDVFILGCCAPQNMRSYGGTFGLVDAMRIGPDNGGNWDGWLTSPRATTSHYFLNGRIWYNDPDPVYVRTNIPIEEARAMCSWQAITGSLTVFSDSIADLPDDRIDVLRRIMPAHHAAARPVDIIENDQRRIWLVTDTGKSVRRDVIGLFNWTGEPITCDYDMGYIGLDPKAKYAAYDFWSGETMTIQSKLDLPVAPRSCRILAVRPLVDHPFLLSTNRHVTQGMIDVFEEKWAGGKEGGNVLSGRSLVVGNDPYELRMVARARGFEWTVYKLAVSAADQAAGVKIETVSEDNGLACVRITSPVSREVSWSVVFSARTARTKSVFDGK